MDDIELAQRITAYMAENKHASRHKIMIDLNTSKWRMDKLAADGLIKLPPKMSRRVGGTMARKRGAWGKGFSL